MISKKYLFFTLFFSMSVLLSGCGAPDCSEQDSTYTKYSYDEELKECKVSKQIPKD